MALSLRLRAATIFLCLTFATTWGLADSNRFDLAGPKLDVHVTRAGRTLPIAEVPNLQAGDKLWLHPDLPPSQSVRYLLVAVFLRGTTNPPPDKWFYPIETWDRKVQEEGVTITVPNDAQQAILFLAPETGGGFSTLRSAVRARPGTFVRASQDLIQAGYEQGRIEKYLASMRYVPPGDPKALLTHSNLLANTLNLKPNEECFKQPVELQYTCLTQTGSQTLLADGSGQNMMSTLTNGDNAALISSASYTALAGGGMYSAYVGTVVDLVHIMGGLHTAHYLYIPAIAFPDGDSLNLRLNTPPSFSNPKSVIVIGLPPIQKAVPPPLRAADDNHVNCLLKPSVVLPLEGAPLVFSTGFAHDLVLHINQPGTPTDIDVTPNAYQGGLILAPVPLRRALPVPTDDSATVAKPTAMPATEQKPDASGDEVTGTIEGYWGFDKFTGPTLKLQDVPGKGWKLASGDVLIAGKENHLTLTSTGTACISSIALQTAAGTYADAQWKPTPAKPDSVDVTVSLKSLDPGSMHLAIHQYGLASSSTVTAQTFSEPAKLDSLELHAGDTSATLTGTSLDQVKQLAFGSLVFMPASQTTPVAKSSTETLRFALPQDSPTPRFRAGENLAARFTLNDGRTLTLPVTVAPARPSVVLISKKIVSPSDSPIHLADPDDLPLKSDLTFSLKSAEPFPRTGQIEIANTDNTLHTMLSVSTGTLVLQNPHTLLATLDPLRSFGNSAFGPLRLRAVAPDGTTGDWIPLATLVRLPDLEDVHCPADATAACTLDGDNLYLIDSIATDPSFTAATTVPDGYIGATLSLARPAKTGFYLRLRDDPAAANLVTVPVTIPRPVVAKSESRSRHAAQQAPSENELTEDQNAIKSSTESNTGNTGTSGTATTGAAKATPTPAKTPAAPAPAAAAATTQPATATAPPTKQ
ncbi:hypothetical protein GCM10011507_07140 [Edaphobacter acidisoli]|uniref:Uncharacterized protein n=1 Tax=Edaphobacter acidisoli TaxID=2040573 RepID=A0A916RK16_9BACT|nr:hypothetical protein [Edaphobacter acidisoli]GGA58338.1 hypothetical protein GCM10011507_07140 [Edaphobacter acidisoli]